MSGTDQAFAPILEQYEVMEPYLYPNKGHQDEYVAYKKNSTLHDHNVGYENGLPRITPHYQDLQKTSEKKEEYQQLDKCYENSDKNTSVSACTDPYIDYHFSSTCQYQDLQTDGRQMQEYEMLERSSPNEYITAGSISDRQYQNV